jgi:hypothetical protein
MSDFRRNVANRGYNRPMRRRQEVPPNQELEDLRKARDRYSALADQLLNATPQPPDTREMLHARALDARRVAAAYENSFNIQNALLNRR